MAEIKRKPVVYTYGPEGRDACWAALTNSWNELARRQNKSASSNELMAWTTGDPEETSEIDSTTRTMTTTAIPETAVPEETAAVEMATTPPPPPMMRSPPKLKRRVAGGGNHRRRSYSEWGTPARGHAPDGFQPSDLADLLKCLRPPDLGLADSCCDYDDGDGDGAGGRHRFDWNDEAPAAEQQLRKRRLPSSSAADDGSGHSRPPTPASLPSTAVIEDEPATISADEREVTVARVEDEPKASAVVENEPKASAVVENEPLATEVVENEPLATEVVEDEPTLTVVEYEATNDASDTPSTTHCTGGDEAHDEQTTMDKPPPQNSLPWATVYRETKIKEIDDTIVSYSKSLLITVLVVVLIRIIF